MHDQALCAGGCCGVHRLDLGLICATRMACDAASANPSRSSPESGPCPATLSLGRWYVTWAYTPGPASVVYGYIRTVQFHLTAGKMV